jgi:hypothetical protein
MLSLVYGVLYILSEVYHRSFLGVCCKRRAPVGIQLDNHSLVLADGLGKLAFHNIELGLQQPTTYCIASYNLLCLDPLS